MGPLDESTFRREVETGVIRAETLVWREGMKDWQPYREVYAATVTPAAAPPQVPGQVPGGQTMGPVFAPGGSADQVTRRSRADWEFGGFWIRALAYFIDAIVVNVLGFILGFGLGFAIGAANPGFHERDPVMFELVIQLLVILFAIAYSVVMTGHPRTQATLGKLAVGLRVIRDDGGRVSYMRALGRYFAMILSALPLFIGYIIAAFDGEKRTLHDRLAGTRVVKTDSD